MISKTDFTPLLDEMNLEPGKVYAIVGYHDSGKTSLIESLSAYLSVEIKQKGIFISVCDNEELSDRLCFYNRYKSDMKLDKLSCIFGNWFDLSIIENEIKNYNADYLMIDDLYKIPNEKNRNELLSRLKKLATDNGIYIVFTECIVSATHFASISTPVEQPVIDQSDCVLLLKNKYGILSDYWNNDYSNFTCDLEFLKGNIQVVQ